VSEHAARLAGKQPRMYCSAVQEGANRRRILNSARLLGLAAIPGKHAKCRHVSLEPTAGHARLLVINPRRWEAPMLRSRVTELHYITPVANLGSIVTHGVLSHNLAARLPHAPASVADESIQDRRVGRRVPPTMPAVTRLREPIL